MKEAEVTTPTVEAASAYLGEHNEWAEDEVTSAFHAEKAAQAHACRTPSDDSPAGWPADLVEALYRRVAVNLAMRGLPLSLQTSVSEAGVGFARVGGGDREVARLERPYRKLVLG